MSELGDLYRAWRDDKREKKAQNKETSLKLLASRGCLIEVLSDTHFRIRNFDFWPSTGKFLNRTTGKYGRGVFNLLKELERT